MQCGDQLLGPFRLTKLDTITLVKACKILPLGRDFTFLNKIHLNPRFSFMKVHTNRIYVISQLFHESIVN